MCTKKYILLFVLLLCCAPDCSSFKFFSSSSEESAKIFKISLNPAPTSRIICNETEEYLAFQICQAIQAKLVAAHSQIIVNFTREPGEELSRIQIASSANQANTNLFLSLHVYHECSSKPKLNIYYYAKQRFSSQPDYTNLSFINYSDAYLFNGDQTLNWGTKIANYLTQHKNSQFEVTPLLGLPFKPLTGIQAPALGIEIGLKNSEWRPYVAPIAEAILQCILPTI